MSGVQFVLTFIAVMYQLLNQKKISPSRHCRQEGLSMVGSTVVHM
jgi:hypothetical protein